MAGGSSGSSGDYWPGFVDALTNVVIAMVFVIVVLAIALSFALQLVARKMSDRVSQLEQQNQAAVTALAKAQESSKQIVSESNTRANHQLNAIIPVESRIKVEDAGSLQTRVKVRLRSVQDQIRLDFADDAFTMNAQAVEKMNEAASEYVEALAKDPQHLHIQLSAQGPQMYLSENKRNAYVRVMDVRNHLLEKGVRADQIEPRIDADAASDHPVIFLRVIER